MILINRAYSETTPESAADGERSDTGMLAENAEYSFRELVRAMREHPETSCSPTRASVGTWLSTGYSVSDYSTGTEREETLHYSRDNPARNEKYWVWAMRAAGIAQ